MIRRTFATARVLFGVSLFFLFHSALAQDKIYTTDGRILNGKVTEIGPSQIRYTASDNKDLLYIVNESDIDSIIYASGRKDEMKGAIVKREAKEIIPQLNTWSFDLLGFTFLSVSQSYERRLKNGWLGFRIPLYIGFAGGGIAGVGTFQPGFGVYYPQNYPGINNVNNYSSGMSSGISGFSIATGLNPKFYFLKRRVARLFAGPEITIGYSANHSEQNYYIQPSPPPYIPVTQYRYGTFASLAKFGLCLNPVDAFNITFDGGVGAGNIFGNSAAIGWTGLWHIGFALGVNF